MKNDNGETMHWRDHARLRTYVGDIPGGEECRKKIARLLDEIEPEWNEIMPPEGPVFVPDHYDGHADTTYDPANLPMWSWGSNGVSYGDVIFVAATIDEIERQAGKENAKALTANSVRQRGEILSSFVMVYDGYIEDYCAEVLEPGFFEYVLSHELAHVVGLGHAEGSELMKEVIDDKQASAKPNPNTEGLGLRFLYD